jgi:hypothetical protein
MLCMVLKVSVSYLGKIKKLAPNERLTQGLVLPIEVLRATLHRDGMPTNI